MTRRKRTNGGEEEEVPWGEEENIQMKLKMERRRG